MQTVDVFAAGAKRRLGKRKLSEAWDCSIRSIDRWVKDKKIPAPEIIGVQGGRARPSKVVWPAWIAELSFEKLEPLAKAQAEGNLSFAELERLAKAQAEELREGVDFEWGSKAKRASEAEAPAPKAKGKRREAKADG